MYVLVVRALSVACLRPLHAQSDCSEAVSKAGSGTGLSMQRPGGGAGPAWCRSSGTVKRRGMALMRALVFRGPWDLHVEERPAPQLRSGEVLINILATGICGSDVHGFTGENGRRHPGQVMGHETVGRVAEIGADVDLSFGLRAGAIATVNPVISCGQCTACRQDAEQRCPNRTVIGVDPALTSAFAERMAVPARNVVLLPDSMPIELGALVEPLAVGYHAAVRGGCQPDDDILVVGGGPIGQACALATRRLGASNVVVSEPSDERRQLLTDLGFRAVDPTAGDLVELVVGVLGRPATLVLDAVGSSTSIAGALRSSVLDSRIVLVGMNNPQLEMDAYSVSTQERTLIGSFCYSAKHFRETAEWVGNSAIGLDRLVEGRVSLTGAAAAFTALGKGDPISKVLVYSGTLPPATEVSDEPNQDPEDVR